MKVERSSLTQYSFIILAVIISDFSHGSANAQSWDPNNGTFNGSGGFSANETSDPWVGPQLSASNGGELEFIGDVEHNGGTGIFSSTQVTVGGAFNHTNSFQSFAIRESDGQGNFPSLTIVDVANSNVSSRSFDLQSSALSLNSVTVADDALVRDVATLDILQDFDVGGATSVLAGSQVTVGGTFNQTNSFQNFSVRGDDRQGNFSSLTIVDAANSNVSSRNFDLQSSELSINSVAVAEDALVRDVATLDILQDFDVGGATSVLAGSQVTVGGAFNQTNSFQNFSVRADDGQGNFSSLTVVDVPSSNVSCRSFDLQSSMLGLNSVSATGDAVIRDSASLDILQDFDASGAVNIQAGSWVLVGGDLTKINESRNFSAGGSNFFGVRSVFEVKGTTNIIAREFFLDGPGFFSGSVSTVTAAVVSGEAIISPGVGVVREIIFDTTTFTTEDHELEVRSGALYEWEFDQSNNDTINVVGDLRLTDNWELAILAIPDSDRSITPSDQFILFTYSGQLNASVDADGQLTRVIIDDSLLEDSFDASAVAVFDDGAGNVFLTGLASNSLLGDVNLDGVVNFLDIFPLISVLANEEFQFEADANQDGVVNFLDISPFISLLASP